MHMDPILELAEELRAAERSLRSATGRRNRDAMRDWLLEIRFLENRLAVTAPTSALGAAEQLRLAAQCLRRLDASYAGHLLQIAERSSRGKRKFTDLVWLRALLRRLTKDVWGEQGTRAARLVQSAIKGVARPVLVYRSVAHPAGAQDARSRTG